MKRDMADKGARPRPLPAGKPNPALGSYGGLPETIEEKLRKTARKSAAANYLKG